MASRIGFLPSVGVVVVTAAVGAALVRASGTAAVRRINADLQAGRPPTAGLLQGALTLVSGVMLLTPGFITDATALLLLLPPVRALIHWQLGRWAARHVNVAIGGAPFGPGAPFGVPPGGAAPGWPPRPGSPAPAPGGGEIIEGEVVSRGPARDPDAPGPMDPSSPDAPPALPGGDRE